MIIIILFLLFSLYMFWHFEQKRKIRNAAHHREKQQAFLGLLGNVKRKNNDKTDNPKTDTDET